MSNIIKNKMASRDIVTAGEWRYESQVRILKFVCEQSIIEYIWIFGQI